VAKIFSVLSVFTAAKNGQLRDEKSGREIKKAVANIRNRLIINVGPEGHDPTTFGL
jgi:hypothetical protein